MALTQHYLSTAFSLLQDYAPPAPFAGYLKHFFSKNKKYGGRDRRMISNLIYRYLRLSHLFQQQLTQENILTAYFLLAEESDMVINTLLPAWSEHTQDPLDQKIATCLPAYAQRPTILYQQWLGDLKEPGAYAANMLQPQRVFLRARPRQKSKLAAALKGQDLANEWITDDTVALAAGAPADALELMGSGAVVQDASSIRTGHIIADLVIRHGLPSPLSFWDVCAASGGKSILIRDLLPIGDHLVSDIRPSILANLKKRFTQAGILDYQSLVLDVASGTEAVAGQLFDLVLCDVPCSGSGTWARTPEQLFSFQPKDIERYAKLQWRIVRNARYHVRSGGIFAYITCSVFQKENEAIAERITRDLGMTLLHSQYIEGASLKADTMFVAVFTT